MNERVERCVCHWRLKALTTCLETDSNRLHPYLAPLPAVNTLYRADFDRLAGSILWE